MTANDAQSEFWETRAGNWLTAEANATLVAGPFGHAAMARLTLRPGERVLDIGCGSGPTTVELARRVAPGGSVLGVDIAATLAAAARDRAAREGIDNATFAVADAQVEPFGDGAFDAAFSRLGVMFFADPAAAFANILRALRPGGRLAFACWQPISENEWMLLPGVTAAAATGEAPPVPALGEPGPFSLADAGHIDALLTAAGFSEVEVAPDAQRVVIEGDRIEAFAERTLHIGAAGEAMLAADPDTAARIRAAVHAAFNERAQNGRLELAAAAFVAFATRAG